MVLSERRLGVGISWADASEARGAGFGMLSKKYMQQHTKHCSNIDR